MGIELHDKTLKCKEPGCSKDFVFTKGEQAFFLQKAYAEPTRCGDCRKKRKKDRRRRRRELLKKLIVTEDVKVVDKGVASEVGKEKVAVGESASVGLAPAVVAEPKVKKVKKEKTA